MLDVLRGRRDSGNTYRDAGLTSYRDVEVIADLVKNPMETVTLAANTRGRITVAFLYFWVIQDFFLLCRQLFFP